MMCDLPILQTKLSESDSLYSHSSCSCDSEIQSEVLKDDSFPKMSNPGEDIGGLGSCNKSSRPYMFQLEQDVQRLELQLLEEIEPHRILESVIEQNVTKLSSSLRLPYTAEELPSNIAELEVTVSELEQELVALHFQLSQERNERRLAEYRLRHPSPQSMSPRPSGTRKLPISSPSRCTDQSGAEIHHSSGDDSWQETRDKSSENSGEMCSLQSIIENAVDSVASSIDMKSSRKMDRVCMQLSDFKKLPKGMPTKGLCDHPNQLSEEMVRCMKNIFMSLADSAVPSKSSSQESQLSPMSPRGHLSNSSWWSSSERSMISSWVQSPQVDIRSNSEVLASENACDPYRVRGKLSWADIGNYGLATEVSWMSVGKKQLEYAAGALRKFRVLVEQLAKVNPIHLSCNEKLAFWINLYNALIMHAYLAYGVHISDLKLFSLMQKAAYTVGGHSYSATVIEYIVLKAKPPLHRPQIALILALHKLNVSDEQRKSVVDSYEPLVTFALSCGMYSSPAVRIYTAKNVREELQDAQRDFVRASVGVSNKGRLLVPKMLHCFAKGSMDDSNLAVWISQYPPPHQAIFVEQCISQMRQKSARFTQLWYFVIRFTLPLLIFT